MHRINPKSFYLFNINHTYEDTRVKKQNDILQLFSHSSMGLYSAYAAIQQRLAKFKKGLWGKKEDFYLGIKSKQNFEKYLRTPGSRNDPNGSAWSWSNEGD